MYTENLYLKAGIQDPKSLHIFAARFKNDLILIKRSKSSAWRLNKQTDEN
jgi:hypothetical protein